MSARLYRPGWGAFPERTARTSRGRGPKNAAAHIHGFADFERSTAMLLARKTQRIFETKRARVVMAMGLFESFCAVAMRER
jgi:hypothetical protein